MSWGKGDLNLRIIRLGSMCIQTNGLVKVTHFALRLPSSVWPKQSPSPVLLPRFSRDKK